MNFERLLSYAFANNELIVSTVAKTPEGYPLINRIRSPEAKYPLINFSYIGGGDVKFADYSPFVERVTMEIDLYGDVNYVVKDEVKKVLNDLGFFLIHKDSIKDLYTGIEHTIYHVKQVLTQEMYDKKMETQEKLYFEKYGDERILPDGLYFDEIKNEEYVIENNVKSDPVIETVDSTEIDENLIM